MWRCVVLLSVCCVGLAVAQLGLGLLGDDRYYPRKSCGTNEYYESCTHDCPPEKTCETRKIGISCPAVVTPCIGRCICNEGYYRKTPGGECISEEECGPACGENEEYKECKNPCIEESCDAMGSLIPNCTAPEPCEPGCGCKEGFYKLYNFICVPKCYCRPACGENEEYKDCRNPCIDESCDAMGSLIPNCTAPEPCEPGCACKEGFYKFFKTLCIRKCYCSLPRELPDCRN